MRSYLVIKVNCSLKCCVLQHGESENNRLGIIGGDANLTIQGEQVSFPIRFYNSAHTNVRTTPIVNKIK